VSITIGGSILGGERALDEAEQIVRDCQAKFEVRAVNEEAGEVEAVISTRDVDRYRSIILPQGFDRLLNRFLANPMFLWQHNRHAPLGSVVRIWRDKDQVYAILRFDLKNKFAAEVFRLYKDGIMRAFSVSGAASQIFYAWMSPKEREALREIDPEAYDALDAEEAYYVISELELYEVSAVTVPGNHRALRRALENGDIDQEFAEFFGIKRGLDAPMETDQQRKEPDMDRMPKELVERIDALTRAASELIEERKAAKAAPTGLTDELRAEVRQVVIDTFAEIYAGGDEDNE
jgi:hypothetical protein